MCSKKVMSFRLEVRVLGWETGQKSLICVALKKFNTIITYSYYYYSKRPFSNVDRINSHPAQKAIFQFY